MNSADNNFFLNGKIDLGRIYQHALSQGISSGTPSLPQQDSFQNNTPEANVQTNYLSPFSSFNPIQIDSKNILN